MDGTGLLLLVVILLVALVVVIWLVARRRRNSRDPLSDRLAEYGARDTPLTLEEIELSQPFHDRVVVPILKKLSELTKPFKPEKQLEDKTPTAVSPGDESPDKKRQPQPKPDISPTAPQSPPPPPQAAPGGYSPPGSTPREEAKLEREKTVGDEVGAAPAPAPTPPTPHLPAPMPAVPSPITPAAPLPPVPAAPQAEPAARGTYFSAYYPKEVVPEQWQPLHAYVFRDTAASAVEADAGRQLGVRAPEFRGVRGEAIAPVQAGALITATPHIDGFQFNPPSLTAGFYEDWQRFDFKLRAKDAPLNRAANGAITFTVEGVIVGDVPLAIFVGETAAPTISHAVTSRAYQAVFCSYSHQDTAIVKRVEAACKALGMDYLRDVTTLRSGQDWSDELRRMIERADIFQLFWSQAAAKSEHVRFEWEHALKVKAGQSGFIRPVYWQQPQPPIPPELRALHFDFRPELGE